MVVILDELFVSVHLRTFSVMCMILFTVEEAAPYPIMHWDRHEGDLPHGGKDQVGRSPLTKVGSNLFSSHNPSLLPPPSHRQED